VNVAEVTTVEGQTTLVVRSEQGLPTKLEQLLSEMTPFGFAVRRDIVPAGARPSCTVLREHRLTVIREGRWFARFGLRINAGFPQPGETRPTVRVIPPGVINLRLSMCEDCGAVCVRDVSVESYAGGRSARLYNRETGATRVAPAVAARDVVLGWYSGKRAGGREYR
jgi:hypothetical protein